MKKADYLKVFGILKSQLLTNKQKKGKEENSHHCSNINLEKAETSFSPMVPSEYITYHS